MTGLPGVKTHILLVDDEPDFLEPIVDWLDMKGYQVATRHSGKDAVEYLTNQMPDIVFMDINMRGGDGLTALEEMRKIHHTLPIFLITSAYDHKYYFEKAQKLGASGFFPKKSSLEELLTIIEATVRLRAKKPGEG